MRHHGRGRQRQSPALTPTGTVTVTATGGGTIAGGGTCGLVADTGDSNASCSVAYTPPANVAAAAAAPIVTGTYPGDATFAPGAGSETLDCTSGAVFQATTITSSDPSANGFRVGSPVTLQGCGFTAATVVDFGSTDAQATATDVTSDGKTLTVTVPPYAISGPVTVVDKTFITTRTTTLTAPDPVTIDSWRNTNGFSFHNFHGAITAADLLTEYPKSGLTLTPGSTTLQQWAASFLDDAQKAAKTGLCFGLALASGEVADGYLSPTVFGFTANSAYDLSRTATLDRYMGQLWRRRSPIRPCPTRCRRRARAAARRPSRQSSPRRWAGPTASPTPPSSTSTRTRRWPRTSVTPRWRMATRCPTAC